MAVLVLDVAVVVIAAVVVLYSSGSCATHTVLDRTNSANSPRGVSLPSSPPFLAADAKPTDGFSKNHLNNKHFHCKKTI